MLMCAELIPIIEQIGQYLEQLGQDVVSGFIIFLKIVGSILFTCLAYGLYKQIKKDWVRYMTRLYGWEFAGITFGFIICVLAIISIWFL